METIVRISETVICVPEAIIAVAEAIVSMAERIDSLMAVIVDRVKTHPSYSSTIADEVERIDNESELIVTNPATISSKGKGEERRQGNQPPAEASPARLHSITSPVRATARRSLLKCRRSRKRCRVLGPGLIEGAYRFILLRVPETLYLESLS